MAPLRSRAALLAVLEAPAGTARDPFVDPPGFDAAREAIRARPLCERHMVGSYEYIGHTDERGQFRVAGEVCELAIGAPLGRPLDGVAAWFFLASVDDVSAKLELRAEDGSPAPITTTTELPRQP